MQEIELKEETMNFRFQEAYKTLRTNIEFSGENIRAICLTSCTPSEGKSSVSFELAKSFAESGKKVLLVDADLRKSRMKQYYKRGRIRYGLTHYLVANKELEDVTCQTDVPNLNMIFSGPIPPNPSELLGSSRFQKLISAGKELYDMVIVDTPPLGTVIDAAVVARVMDGSILVIESGAISYRFVRQVQDQLMKAGSKILGVVLNKVNLTGKSHGRYYGGYYGE
ncbi:MAG: polysaccharide biosynthesis tyrosine autokinase, partial [Eubacteriales bacterium]|nr:polysaccharide biosynthesis tyrosine autokinase [Eubacteriales bacterium]